jgi:RimJ/RimL family protein N-acetyltransferase
MTTLEIPTLATDRLKLRAFHASDLDAYAAMQANPEVMRYLLTGRTSTRAEVWRTMATFLKKSRVSSEILSQNSGSFSYASRGSIDPRLRKRSSRCS